MASPRSAGQPSSPEAAASSSPAPIALTSALTSPLTSVIARLAWHASAMAEQPALAFVSRDAQAIEWSWSELLGRVRKLAGHLVTMGTSPGDVVFVLSAAPHEQVLGFLAAMAAGALPSILSFPSLKQSEERFHETLRPIAEATRARAILCAPEFLPTIERAPLSARAIPLPPLQAASDADVPLPEPSTAFLQFSSGTTGLRKCVRITGEMLACQAAAYARALALGPTDRIVSWLPLYHDMGLVACGLLPLLCGNLSVHLSPFDWLQEPALLLRAATSYRASFLWLPNFAYQLCADQIPDEQLAGVDLRSLRAVINCSEPVRPQAHERFAQRFAAVGLREEHLQACYAMAESTFAVTQTALAHPVRVDRVVAAPFAAEHRAVPVDAAAPPADTLRFVSCGRPIEGVEVRIAEAAGAAAPSSSSNHQVGHQVERQVGEILIRGGCVIPGYGVDGTERLDAFTEDGWYRTGDLGYLAEGELFVTGRAKDLIIHRGANVYPTDLEEAVADVDGIKPGRLVALGLYDEAAGTENVIVLCETAGSSEPADLRRRIRERIWLRLNVAVADIDVCEPGTLRKSTSGKPSRSGNRQLYLERRPAAGAQARRERPAHLPPHEKPRDLWEQQLTWIWEEVLGVGPIGITDNLYLELGADSVSTMRAAAEVRGRLGRTVLPATLLGADTIERQAALLRTEDPAARSPLMTLQRTGPGLDFFLVHAAGGWAFPYVSLARHLHAERPVHAFQALELYTGDTSQLTVESLAERYLAALRAIRPRGPYLLGGWSFGGLVAFEMATRLVAAGERVERLILLDTSAPIPPWHRIRALPKRYLVRAGFRLALHWRWLRSRLPVLRQFDTMSPVWRFFVAYFVTGEEKHLAPLLDFSFGAACDHERLARLDGDLAWDYVMELATAHPTPSDRALLVPGLDGRLARAALRVSRRLTRLGGRYNPARRYAGRVDILGLRDNAELAGWDRVVTGPLEIHPFDIEAVHSNPHFDMLEEENVRRYAPTLRRLLAEADHRA